MTETLHDYFKNLQALGAPRATRLVTKLSQGLVASELRDANSELTIEVSACHSRRALYRSFLAELVWTMTFDSKGRVTSQRLLVLLILILLAGPHSATFGRRTIPT
jgi:hypothetical protein